MERDLPARLRENGWAVARAAGQLSSRPLGGKPSKWIMGRADPAWLDKLKQKREYLAEWLARVRSASRIAPQVQKDLEFTEWQIKAIDTRPVDADEIPMPELDRTADSDLANLPSAYPWLPQFNEDAPSSASAFTSTGTLSVSIYVGRVGDLDSQPAKEYSADQLSSLGALQAKHDRPSEVRALIARLRNPATLERLDRALQSYQSFQTGTGTRSAAAIDMRTLLDGVKGDLFQLARSHDQDNMSWETMARRLARGPNQQAACDELIGQLAARTSLIERLSDIAKDREGGSLTDLHQVWLEIQNHLIAVLGLVRFASDES